MLNIIWQQLNSEDIIILILAGIGIILLLVSIGTLMGKIVTKNVGFRIYLLVFAFLSLIALIGYIVYTILSHDDPMNGIAQSVSIICLAISPLFLMIFAVKVFNKSYNFRLWKILFPLAVGFGLLSAVFPEERLLYLPILLIVLLMLAVIVKNITVTAFRSYQRIEPGTELQMRVGLIIIGTSGILYLTFLILLIVHDQTGFEGLRVVTALMLLLYVISFYLGYVMPAWFSRLLGAKI